MVMFDAASLKEAITSGNLDWKKHVTERLIERDISRQAVLDVLCEGEVIREYPDDSPFPSALFMGFVRSRPIHVVAAYSKESGTLHIVTAYEPTTDTFLDDLKTKRQ